MNSKSNESNPASMLELEIESQLHSDILSYSWLVSITKRMFDEMDFEQRANMLVDAISNLADRLNIDIGPTKSIDSVSHVESWAETPEAKVEKLREFIQTHGPPNYETNFSFWIGLPSENSEL